MVYTTLSFVATNLIYNQTKRDLSLFWNQMAQRWILLKQNSDHEKKAWYNSNHVSTTCK